jgi:hypothetical protein
VKAIRLDRAALVASALEGVVLARDVRDASGRIAFPKGKILTGSDATRLCELPWDQLHALAPEAGDLHELEAGECLARAAAGEGVTRAAYSGGHWPLVAQQRGILSVRTGALQAVNRLAGVAVYTLFDGQVVDGAETVGRAKIVPFVIAGDIVARAASMARDAGGLVTVHPFPPTAVGAVVQESLGTGALARFRDALGEKVAWFASRLLEPRFVVPEAGAVADAIAGVIDEGARVVVLAGSRPMDPLDAAFDALTRMGARIARHGAPAHPGSLLWLAWVDEIPVVGMPACGLFSRATVFDLVLPRLLAGERVDNDWFAALGHGGLLTRDMAFRFPAYRASRDRGEVE